MSLRGFCGIFSINESGKRVKLFLAKFRKEKGCGLYYWFMLVISDK